ncbi:hypothetical protein P8452_09593 [Trifolium repens]|nr:hypothetical protein P8452_09593 [Trifolium repens]
MSTILAGGHHLMPRQNITPYHTKSPPELQNSQILPDPKQTSAPRTESNLTHCQSAENQTKLPDPPPARKRKTTERRDTVGTTERTEQKTKNNWDDFRKTLKEVNYDSKDGKRVSKEIGEKWWSMTDAEKKPYLDRVIELKAEYEKAMEIYNATKKEDQQEGL